MNARHVPFLALHAESSFSLVPAINNVCGIAGQTPRCLWLLITNAAGVAPAPGPLHVSGALPAMAPGHHYHDPLGPPTAP